MTPFSVQTGSEILAAFGAGCDPAETRFLAAATFGWHDADTEAGERFIARCGAQLNAAQRELLEKFAWGVKGDATGGNVRAGITRGVRKGIRPPHTPGT